MKYFTPEIEDIRIGYECQIRNNATTKEHWLPENELCSLNKDTITSIVYKIVWENNIRVPYLTQEQVEKEGWKYSQQYRDGSIIFITNTEREGYELLFKPDYKICICKLWYLDMDKKQIRHPLFEGECKDINTFRNIIKLINI